MYRFPFSLSGTVPGSARILGLGLALACGFAVQASPWAKVKATAPGPVSVIGGTANGCIRGAQSLPAQGEGFVSLRRHRNRYYGHPQTLALIEDLGRALSARTSSVMMVGDLSQPRGGLMSSSHRSHQNGLDVDIWFRLSESPERAESAYPEARNPRSLVAADGVSLTSAWGPQQRFLLQQTAEDPRVDRIFVNPTIKRALCQEVRGARKWLSRLRPWWGHDAHFHVRLQCPQDSPLCQRQAPLSTDPGCGPELAWWFSEEARKPGKKSSRPAARPSPPAACQTLLTGF